MSGVHTVDGRNPTPPKKPWNDDSPVNTNKQWLPMVSKWCRISSIHSMAMGHNQWLHFGMDEHPFATYFDVRQGYRVLTHSHITKLSFTGLLIVDSGFEPWFL